VQRILSRATKFVRVLSFAVTSARDIYDWIARDLAMPALPVVKRACVLRNGLPRATWIETGTYKGYTTQELARVASRVISIEPHPGWYARAQRRFGHLSQVTLIQGLSEEVLPGVLEGLEGDVCFWLDGHYSGPDTFKGPQDTPILSELEAITPHLSRLGKVVVMIDDIRFFNGNIHSYGHFPTLDTLVDWARQHNLTWHIEHDVFVARS
jgi:hypothetical protein